MTDFQAFVAAVDAILAQPLVEQQRYLSDRYEPRTGTSVTVTPLPLTWAPGRWEPSSG